MSPIKTLFWDGALHLLDQTRLPAQTVYETFETTDAVYHAIATMKVRGAPAIGVAAGYGMVLAAKEAHAEGGDFLSVFQKKGAYLNQSRPTAVNLSWAINRMVNKARELSHLPWEELFLALEAEAIAIHKEDESINRAIGENLLSLLKDGDTVLTHCNAGILATTAYGTALSPFYLAKEKGMKLHVYADETRPRLQGASLTAYELQESGVDVTLICDNMAAVVMSQGKIDAVITGCDRVAANGDTANKIGTFNVSILANHFGIPMYIAAPTPTIDLQCPTGKEIPIEERDGNEIRFLHGVQLAPRHVKTYNPAFDITPAQNITAIVTEKGIIRPPYQENLKKILG